MNAATDQPPRPAVFLDRDGTLIRDVGYLRDPRDIDLLPGVADALRALRSAGFLLVVVSNQSGIARGYLDAARLRQIETEISARLAAQDAHVDAWYHCPHLDEGCECRKPRPGMILAAARDHAIDLARSYVVGDAERDVEAGAAAGLRAGYLIGRDVADLRAAAGAIVQATAARGS